MMRQYLQVKADYPDCILFFRLGDFYEMFFEDAVLASQILEIALTTREKGKERPIPMCGVPYHAAAPYIAKLIEHGHKVALCEQVEDPKQARGIVRREVVRVITPGMVVEEENLPEGENNYLMSLFPDRGGFGLCFFDLSTGEFKGCLLRDEDLLGAEIRRNRPKEALLPEGEEGWGRTLRGLVPSLLVNFRPVGDFVPLPDPSIPEGLPEALGAAAAAVLHYVRSTQRERPGHIRPLSPYEVQGYLVLDETTQRNLELFETSRGSGTSLFRVLDRTATSMGRRRLRLVSAGRKQEGASGQPSPALLRFRSALEFVGERVGEHGGGRDRRQRPLLLLPRLAGPGADSAGLSGHGDPLPGERGCRFSRLHDGRLGSRDLCLAGLTLGHGQLGCGHLQVRPRFQQKLF